jgi:hypothetical protein
MDMIDPTQTLDIGQIKKFAAIAMARKKLKQKYDELGKKLEGMMPGLINHLITCEVNKVPLIGGRTVYIDTKIWAKNLEGKTGIDVAAAAKKDGIFELLGGKEAVNAQTLASYLRELDQNQEKLPKNLAGVIKPNPVSKLIVKKH